ncbi:MAG: PQQ-binding-like beta-propeller repeat protein [Phycisphaerae bacterium]
MSTAARLHRILALAMLVMVATASASAGGKTTGGGESSPAKPAYSGGYRGVGRDGVYPAENLLDKWPEEGPKLLWTYNGLGSGWSSVTIHDGRAYVLGGTNPGRLFCFDIDSGKLIYKAAYGPDRTEGRFAGTRSTLEIAGDKAVFASGDGVIHCRKVSDGSKIWAVDTVKDFGNKIPGHGYNITPLIYKDKVISAIRRGKHTHVALDLETGKVVWASEPSTLAIGDSSPVLVPHEKKPLIVDNLWHAFVAIDPENGKIVWKRKDGRTGTMMTPIYSDGYVFADMGRHRAVLLERVDAGGSDEKEPFREVWKLDHGLDDISQALILDGRVYYMGRLRKEIEVTVEKKGKTQKRKKTVRPMFLFARDLRTGKLIHQEKVRASGSLAAADGMIYLVTGGEMGWKSKEGIVARLHLIKPTKDGFEQVSAFNPVRDKKEAWINPAIGQGRLFFRQGNRISCYDLRPESYKESTKDE